MLWLSHKQIKHFMSRDCSNFVTLQQKKYTKGVREDWIPAQAPSMTFFFV